jgi:hypothetical protein
MRGLMPRMQLTKETRGDSAVGSYQSEKLPRERLGRFQLSESVQLFPHPWLKNSNASWATL